jgi:hypothetical protein
MFIVSAFWVSCLFLRVVGRDKAVPVQTAKGSAPPAVSRLKDDLGDPNHLTAGVDLAQETAARPAIPSEFVVQRVIQRQQLSQTGGQLFLYFHPEERLLVLLLGLVPTAVERV